MSQTDETSRRDLLDKLKLDRTMPEPRQAGPAGLVFGIVGLVLGLVFAGGAAVFFWPAAPAQPASSEAAPVNPGSETAASSAPASSSSGGAVLTASGYVTARRLATVSAEVTGQVSEILVEEGTPVKQGQVLARLDPKIAQINLAIAKANANAAAAALDAAIAQRDNAVSVLQRVTSVPRGTVASDQERVKALADANNGRALATQAEANRLSAETQVAFAQEMLAKTEIRSPFDGIVTTKDAQPGEIVSPQAAGGGSTRTGICTVVDMNSLEIDVDVSESYIGRVAPGQKARATLDAYPDWAIPASVIAIIPTASRDKATVKVRVAIDTKDPRVLPDMGAKVNFLSADKTDQRATP